MAHFVVPARSMPSRNELRTEVAKRAAELGSPWIAEEDAFIPRYTASVTTTKHCRLACPHCQESASPKRQEKLEPERFDKVLENFRHLARLYPVSLQLTGGDPLDDMENTVGLVRTFAKKFDRATDRHIVVRTTGLAAAEEENIEPIREMLALGSEFRVRLKVFQRAFLREQAKRNGDLPEVQRFVRTAYQNLSRLLGKDLKIPDLNDEEFDELPPDPVGRASSLKLQSYRQTRTCWCYGIEYTYEGGNGGRIIASREGGLLGSVYHIDHLGGLHFSYYTHAPIIDLSADHPLEKLDTNSLAVHLSVGGPLFAAEQLLSLKREALLAYYQYGMICRCCYLLAQMYHPQIC